MLARMRPVLGRAVGCVCTCARSTSEDMRVGVAIRKMMIYEAG
jgi:hypothetical protein